MKKLLFLISFFCTLPSIAVDHNDHKNDLSLSYKNSALTCALALNTGIAMQTTLDYMTNTLSFKKTLLHGFIHGMSYWLSGIIMVGIVQNKSLKT